MGMDSPDSGPFTFAHSLAKVADDSTIGDVKTDMAVQSES
jgi:hypothetical protein